ncbi:MAG: PEP-CTERM sorting domain-containing protein [Burkholderiaceae bacterium]|nr:PEP-CTERM sorting domain-containing protein [Burkholderiaceae bacterium]
MSIKSLVFTVAAAATWGVASLANAAVCSGSVPASYSPALTDVTIDSVSADSCAYYAGNDNRWTPGSGWTNLGKSDAENPISGVVNLDPSGTISLSLLLTPPDEPVGGLLLGWTGGPALMDFVFVLKSANEYFTYTFNDFLLTPAEGDVAGSYRVAIENANEVTQALSHLTFWAKGSRADEPGPDPIPEPGALALLGIGLAAWAARKGRNI